MTPAGRDRRTLLVAALAIFALALALRAGHLVSLREGLAGTHLFSTGRVDAADHLREAAQILDGDPWLLDRVHWKGPGFSYFLALSMAVLGRDAGRLRWVGAVLGALNCAGLVLLARRFLPARGAVLAGLLAACNGTLLLFDGELYFPTLLIASSLVALGLLLAERGGAKARAAAGVAVGLAVLVHPVYALVALGVTAWLAREGRRPAIAFAAAAALVVLPLPLKHLLVHGQPVLVAWNGGINLYLGNQPGYDQLSGQGTEAWDRVFLTPLDAAIVRESERDRLYYRLAMRQAADEPGTALAILLEKARIFFAPVEVANNFRIYELARRSAVASVLLRAGPPWLPFGVWAPLAWVGAFLLARRHGRKNALLVLWCAALALSCVLFFNTARYRVPVVFLGSIWAAATLDAGWQALRERRWKALAGGSTAVVALGIVTATIARPQVVLPPPIEFTEAQVLEQRGRLDEAERRLESIVLERPDDRGMLLGAAAFHARHGNDARHRELLLATLASPDPSPDDRFRVHELLAESWLRDGALGEAERAFEDALAVGIDDATWRGHPWFPLHLGPLNDCRIRLRLARVYELRGEHDRARSTVEGVLRTCEPHGRIAEALGSVRLDGREPR